VADRLARRFRDSRGTSAEDLVQTARAGVIDAIDRYDPGYGTSWRLHIARPLKERSLRLCRAADELHQRLGRSPTTAELAEQLDMDEEEVLDGLAAGGSRHEVSLDQPVGNELDGSLGELVVAPAAREEPEDLLALPGLVSTLPELEREVIVLRFFQDLDQDTIAARVGFSQMHVSRLQRRALARMRAQLVEP
jgi:RNA polymerase sigma-B factor